MALTLLSCGTPQHAGTIIEKWYEPREENLVLLPICMANGKSVTTVLVPYLVTDNEDFCIKIKEMTKKGKERSHVIYLNKDTYDTISIGQYYCSTGECDDNNNTKVEQR